MRLIDADALKESLKKLKAEANNKKYEQGLQDAIDGYFPQIIDGAPTIEAEPVKHGMRLIDAPTIEVQPDKGWVSVDDRLPEIKEHYRSELVMCYSPDGEHEYLFDYYEMNGFGQGCFTAEKYFGITITHWRHLPEPPKGE